MMNYEDIKKEIEKNEGITLIDGKKMNYKTGYIVSLKGFEVVTKSIDDAIKTLVNYGKNNKIVGVWYNDGFYYIDVNKYFNKDHKKDAIKEGLKNNQKAIYDIKSGQSIYLKKDYYIIYKYDVKMNDFRYMLELDDIKKITALLDCSFSSVTHSISQSIDNLKNLIYWNGSPYAIIKENDFIY